MGASSTSAYVTSPVTITSSFVTSISKGPRELIKYSSCSKEQTLCHPLFYGLNSGGSAFCADKGVS